MNNGIDHQTSCETVKIQTYLTVMIKINILFITVRSLDSSVGVATSYGLDDRGGRSLSPGMVKHFLHVVHTGSGVHPTSYPMGTRGSFPGGKAAGA
jgi:hypothetical protein